MIVISRKRNVALQIYWLLVFVFALILMMASIYYKAEYSLVIATIVYFAVVLFPMAATNFNWVHPLIFQMIYEIPKVFSIACRAVGYTPLNSRWLIAVSNEQCIDSYLKCIFLTCIGLSIEYFVLLRKTETRRKVYNINIGLSPTAFFYMILAIICFFLLMNSLGGVTYVILHFQDRLTEFSSDTSIYLRYFVSFGVLSIYYYYLLNNHKAVIICVFIQTIMYVAMGERGGIVSQIIFPLFVAYQIKNGKMVNIKYLAIGAFSLVLFYEMFGFMRDFDKDVTVQNLFSNIVDTFATESHFVNSSELICLIDTEKVDLTYGAPLLNIFYAPFPRSLFPWKPKYIAESALVGALVLDRDEHVYGLPPGTFAWGYLNFGILGVFLFSIISAMAMKWLYTSFVGPYLRTKRAVPTGNILLYINLVGLIYAITSTEAQIKIIFMSVGLIFLILTSNKKIKTKKKKILYGYHGQI